MLSFYLLNLPICDKVFDAEILVTFRGATQCAPKWAKAWHRWALFNTAVMSQCMRGYPNVASQFVVEAVTGYFHSIACAANAKGVDDSLQVKFIAYQFSEVIP